MAFSRSTAGADYLMNVLKSTNFNDLRGSISLQGSGVASQRELV